MTTKEMRKLTEMLRKFNKYLDASYVFASGYETIMKAEMIVKSEIRARENAEALRCC